MMRVLIADDSSAIRAAVREYLHWLHIEASEATNGQDCLDMAAKSDYAAILLDWNMPVISGIECLRALRSDPAYDPTAIIMITTEDDFARISVALDAGANEYIIKPFDKLILRLKLEAAGVAIPA
ncbi:MAG: response regulator [Planctomycetes bacterium]|nr:response regulator [Planctomycetota bacterium]